MILTSLIVLSVSGVILECKARSLSLSVNFSLALNDGRTNPMLSAEILNNCMKETEISMAELNNFRLSLNEPDVVNGLQDSNDEKEVKNVDYENNFTAQIPEESNEEPLQCFAHCLYEKLGLIKDGVFMEPDFFRKFYTVVEREKLPIRECLNLESNNNCEAAYKLHLCYTKLKNLEAERRIRDILEYNDSHDTYDNNDASNKNITTDLSDLDGVEQTDNEIDNNEIN